MVFEGETAGIGARVMRLPGQATDLDRLRRAYSPFIEWWWLRSAVSMLPMTVSGQTNSLTRTDYRPPRAMTGMCAHPAVEAAPKHGRPTLQAALPGALFRR
ncbi:MAG: hypothetical protein OXI87_14425 [Albidovulum sp.]|nr:hypothetical protein [Albidovulum sp.]